VLEYESVVENYLGTWSVCILAAESVILVCAIHFGKVGNDLKEIRIHTF